MTGADTNVCFSFVIVSVIITGVSRPGLLTGDYSLVMYIFDSEFSATAVTIDVLPAEEGTPDLVFGDVEDGSAERAFNGVIDF